MYLFTYPIMNFSCVAFLASFINKCLCMTNICILTYMLRKKILANGDQREVWERATPFITRAGWFESRLTLTFSIIFSCLEMFLTSNVWFSLTLPQLNITDHLTKK